jgi:hypothetical protein
MSPHVISKSPHTVLFKCPYAKAQNIHIVYEDKSTSSSSSSYEAFISSLSQSTLPYLAYQLAVLVSHYRYTFPTHFSLFVLLSKF